MRNTLHVYGQEYPHDDVYIAGDREAISALKVACENALIFHKEKNYDNFETYASDGEGYNVHVVLKSPGEMEKFSPKYSDPDYDKDGPYPWE